MSIETLLLVRSSYQVGLVAPRLLRAGEATGILDGWRYGVHFFELRLDRLPKLQLDNREIIGARLASPEELRGIEVTGPVAAYLERTLASPEATADLTRSC
jgi:8-oxo-dGTP diphosphatase